MIRFHSRHLCEECAATKPAHSFTGLKSLKALNPPPLLLPPTPQPLAQHHYFYRSEFEPLKESVLTPD